MIKHYMPAPGTKFVFKGITSGFEVLEVRDEVAAVDFSVETVTMRSGTKVTFDAWEWMMENCRNQFVFTAEI